MKKSKNISRPNTAIIYTRVSSQDQLKGFSLGTQGEIDMEYCKKHGWLLFRAPFVEKGKSAKTTDRPVLQEMLKFIAMNKGKIGYLVVYKIDRLARNNYDYVELKIFLAAYNVELRSATEHLNNSATGKLTEIMLAGISQFDNDVRTERTVTNMKAALEEGFWTFQAAVGYKNSKEVDPTTNHKFLIVDEQMSRSR